MGNDVKEPWTLPVVPENAPTGNATDKRIPRDLWIAVRDLKEPLNYQMQPLFDRNKNWNVHVCSNEMKDEFMNTTFAGTSLLWAYHLIHPIAGAAKADLWRYAVLWTYGGAYIDDDSDMMTPLDNVVEVTDTLVVSYEKNGFNGNRCYIPKYHLSDFATYGDGDQRTDSDVFHGRMLLNWAIIAAPRHPVLYAVMKNAVEIIRQEYMRESVLRSLHTAYAWEIIMCATGPSLLTGSARELVLQNHTNLNIRLGGNDFKPYGGKFKAVHIPVRHDPKHYMHQMNRKGGHVDLLKEYQSEAMLTTEQLAAWDKKAIQGQNGRAIYVLDSGKRRSIPNFDTFLKLGYKMSDVIVLSDARMSAISMGEPMPSLL
jgi:hypothetical protein